MRCKKISWMEFQRECFSNEIDPADGKKVTQQLICALHSSYQIYTQSPSRPKICNEMMIEKNARCKDHGWMREKLELIKSSIQKKETKNPPPSSKFGEHVHLFNVATDSLALRMSSRCEITKKLNTWHLNFFGCCQDEYFSLQRHFSCTLYISNSECILRPPLHRSRNFSLSLSVGLQMLLLPVRIETFLFSFVH